MDISFNFSAQSDIGLVRKSNQDSCYASQNLLIVADGMGGHAAGDIASSIVVAYLSRLDTEDILVNDAIHLIEGTIDEALRAIKERAAHDKKLAGMGTTLSMILRAGGKLVLAHIGDSRIYRLSDGQLKQLTSDHTYVQELVDEGEITEQAAQNHPQKHFVLRAIGDFDIFSVPDFQVFETKPGDRFLACSDGLFGVLSDDTIQKQLSSKRTLKQIGQDLIQLALKASSTDNVSVVVADVVDLSNKNSRLQNNIVEVGGAVATDFELPTQAKMTAAAKAAAAIEHATSKPSAAQAQAAITEDFQAIKKPFNKLRFIIVSIIAALAIAGAAVAYFGFNYLDSQYYVGLTDGDSGTQQRVAVFKGLPTTLLGFDLFWIDEQTDLRANELPSSFVDSLENKIHADSKEAALAIIKNFEDQKIDAAADGSVSIDFWESDSVTIEFTETQ